MRSSLFDLEETDDADPEVEADGGLDDGEGQKKENLNSASEKPEILFLLFYYLFILQVSEI